MGSETPTYVLDANVLIDFSGVELEVFSLAAGHLGYVLVSTEVIIDEVDGLTVEKCEEIGIRCIDPTMSQLAVAQESHGALSFYDLLCFALADARDAICVTNDKRLRNHCQENDLHVRWGLQLMLELVEADALSTQRAEEIATKVCNQNPMLGSDILEVFRDKLSTAGGG